jgi:hypothetical protein
MYQGLRVGAGPELDMKPLREQMLTAVRPTVRLSQLFTYRSLDDEELAQYIVILEKPEMKSFFTLVKFAVQSAIVRRTQVITPMLKQVMQ